MINIRSYSIHAPTANWLLHYCYKLSLDSCCKTPESRTRIEYFSLRDSETHKYVIMRTRLWDALTNSASSSSSSSSRIRRATRNEKALVGAERVKGGGKRGARGKRDTRGRGEDWRFEIKREKRGERVATGEIFLAATAMQQLSPSVIYERPTGEREGPRPLWESMFRFVISLSLSLSPSQFRVCYFLDAMYLEGFYSEIKINRTSLLHLRKEWKKS